MEPRSEATHPGWPFPFTPQDWEQTPPAVQAYLHTVHDALGQLQERVETLEARLTQNSTTSSSAAVVGLALQEAAPASDRHHPAESWWETGPSRPSPGALAPHDRARGAARALSLWEHDVRLDQAIPYASSD